MVVRSIFDDDHRLFRDSVSAFVDRKLIPRLEESAKLRSHPRDLWLELGRNGFLGLGIEVEFGGSDARDYRFNTILLEELARASAASASAFSIHFDVCAPYLAELTSEAQKKRWLPRFCTGELITAIAMTEVSGGSDLAGIRTSARRHDEEWVLDGSKTFVTNGASADLIIVAAKTLPDVGAHGISLFAVEKGTPGMSVGRKLDKIGQHEADTAELFFEDCRIPATSLLGNENQGFIHMMERLPQERLGAAVSNIAHARAILMETIEYAKERMAFGQSIGSFQHNSFVLAELTTRADVSQAFVDQCVMAHTTGTLTPADAAKAKWWTAEVQGEILDACVQLFGGYGYMREYRVARAWADARVTKIWAGSNEIMKLIISKDLGLI